ncbi:hypothetical protein [Salinibius halmophilus]|uniref:hypothetical protein n=1 Tax=Salinibius halmophilus TaxID=1853216 RepID=UPI000E676259|nr:hypothetical protein [Salinibius halmophilus]
MLSITPNQSQPIQNAAWLHKRVVVIKDFDLSTPLLGKVTRYDNDAPWQVLIELDTGECLNQFQCCFKLATEADG